MNDSAKPDGRSIGIISAAFGVKEQLYLKQFRLSSSKRLWTIVALSLFFGPLRARLFN